MDPLTLTVRDTAKALGLGRSKIYQLISQGRLEAVKVDRRTLIKTTSIHALVNKAPAA